MTTSIIIFIISITQFSLILVAYFKQWPEVFNIAFIHFSPVMIFMGILERIGIFTGAASDLVWAGLAYCMVKYTLLIRSLIGDNPNFFNYSAAVAEVLMIAGSTFYIVRHVY